MHLHSILKDRAAVNTLKILYDAEHSEKKHTMLLIELKDKLVAPETPFTLQNLKESGLIALEQSGSDNIILSITKKGMCFVEQFDKLLDVFNNKKKEHKAFNVEYNLTDKEKRILFICSKINTETGKEASLSSLTEEVYPYQHPATKTSSVSKYAKRLEEINLLKRIKNNNRVFFEITDSGKRVVKEQLEKLVVN
jgi:predicted transcriptional regulator